MADILVYALAHEGQVNKNSKGAISEAARLAGELGGEAHVVLVGTDLSDELAQQAGAVGATKVFTIDAAEGIAATAIDGIAALVDAKGYDWILFGGGLLGFEIGAGLAARIGGGVTVEVTDIKVDGGKLVAERPIFGDTLLSHSNYKSKGVIVARTNAFEVKETGGTATVEAFDAPIGAAAGQVNLKVRGEARGADVNIEDASILITGGRGLGNAENFSVADALSAAFGGNSAVAATRAVVDAGWFPYAGQIGQTGKSVAPKLYVGLGVSGAIQHKVGMQSSENVLAINKDENAPIFEFAD
ncbi:MAG: electron transfer flavoprotein subunit alpha/FixB family protein, partial [Solirubrobacteraceae bacterium]|nr:electron transfer flavoprotein subunit alpha/FixB family protein [Solirubrobacteraceae bacterium]